MKVTHAIIFLLVMGGVQILMVPSGHSEIVPQITLPQMNGTQGEIVTLPVSFTAGDTPIAGLQFDLDLPEGVRLLKALPGLAAVSAVAADKNLASGGNQPAYDVRVFVLGSNQKTIQSGIIGYLQLNITRDASLGMHDINIISIVAVHLNGNSIPIHSNTPSIITVNPDTSPPVSMNGRPTGILEAGTARTSLSLTTSETSTCGYSMASGLSYANMTKTFLTTDGRLHSTLVMGLQNGQSYRYYVRCIDQFGNANHEDYVISFSVANITFADAARKSVAGTVNFLNDALGQALIIVPGSLPGTVGMGIAISGYLAGIVKTPA